jgi:hypothetical protein
MDSEECRRKAGVKDLRSEVKRMLAVLDALGTVQRDLMELDEEGTTISPAVKALQEDRRGRMYLESVCERLTRRIERIQNRLLDVEYPFSHARSQVSLTTYIMERVPGERNGIEATLDAAEIILGNAGRLYRQAVGRLAEFAQFAEMELGLGGFPKASKWTEKLADLM